MKKHFLRALAVGSLVAAGFGVSSHMSPASADSCNNEAQDHNYYVNSTSVGLDDGTTGWTGVYVLCVRSPLLATTQEVCAGDHIWYDAGGDMHNDVVAGYNGCNTVPLTLPTGILP